ncbi:hypothetical protein QOZ98_002443 [Planomicrobium stackebrandtii]|uniref:YhfM-like domain-containing protein n=1 Tax=Planomicrobium stackebrandtii TaxID=253160 RepID=A0ABU0GW71_9BACL|nr:hypothetical protein [Planomicrobium stackebrandtii]MDQ0429615.1 hypothetical protein [Planomicrobium stackebrandtii]
MKKWSLLFILVVFTLSFVGGCSSENIEKLDVYEMESFSVIKKESLTSYTDSQVVSQLVKAFKKAKKEPGIVDMADPDYKVEFGEESYYLWISKEQGTIMNLDDTNFIYTLSQSSSKKIYELLN